MCANIDNDTQHIYHNRADIENKIIEYNKSLYKRAYTYEIYKSKIYKYLNRDYIRDKILNGYVILNNCENEIMLSFVKLLK